MIAYAKCLRLTVPAPGAAPVRRCDPRVVPVGEEAGEVEAVHALVPGAFGVLRLRFGVLL